MRASLILTTVTKVQTTGINWESVAAIVTLTGVLITVMLFMIGRRDRQQDAANEAIKQEISEAVSHLGDVLIAKLETKETVARISERLARVEGAMKLEHSGD